MAKKKALVITGTRADYGLMRPVIFYLQKSRKLKPAVLATGMHALKKFGYTLNEVKKEDPNVFVVPISGNDDMLKSFVKEVSGIRTYCLKNRPDFILVLGDRDEMLAGAIVGAHLKIPVGHINAGDASGYVVDEYNRHAVTKMASLLFASTEQSRKRLLKMGEEEWRVHKVGPTGLDGLNEIKFLSRKAVAQKFKLNPVKKWFIILMHPAPLDNVGFNNQIKPLLNIIRKYDAEKIVIYPNSDTGGGIFIKEIEKRRGYPDFHIYKNIARGDYLNFLKICDLLLGNSSSGLIESAYFKTSTINIGHRQIGRDRGENVIDCGYNADSIKRAIRRALAPVFLKNRRHWKSPYGRRDAAKEIVKIIERNIDNKNLVFKNYY